jgi:acyl-[acyl carrier protein]--UDP-N-acetylglucosamine O-acyltransferase
VRALRRAYKLLYKSGLGLAEALEAIRADCPGSPEADALALDPLISFLDTQGRGIVR